MGIEPGSSKLQIDASSFEIRRRRHVSLHISNYVSGKPCWRDVIWDFPAKTQGRVYNTGMTVLCLYLYYGDMQLRFTHLKMLKQSLNSAH